MKHHLLLALAVCGGTITAQTNQSSRQNYAKHLPFSTIGVPYEKTSLSEEIPFYNAKPENTHVKPQFVATAGAPFDEKLIGTTFFDAQTNAAPCNRIVLNSDGTISAAWNFSNTAGHLSFPNRGSGYNYFDGTSWGPAPTANVEPVRTGWTNVGVSSYGEVISAHSNSNEIYVSTRVGKGSGAWSHQTISGYTGITTRMGVGGPDGKSIHIISEAVLPLTNFTPYKGQRGAVTYTRSTDFGATWDKQNITLDAIDSSQYVGFWADTYSMDVKGSTIAIALGEPDKDVVLLKSTDNGETWTKTLVDSFPMRKWDYKKKILDANNDGIGDTLLTNDGNIVVRLDNNFKAHVAFGNMQVSGTDTTAKALQLFLGTDGLLYWNENMGSADPVIIAGFVDSNGDGGITYDTTNLTSLLPFGRYSSGGITSMPSIAFDANNNVYVSYSTLRDGEPYADQKSIRHTHIIRSDDGGSTWTNPLDIVGDPYSEGVWGVLAPVVDTDFHLIYQKDDHPGHSLSSFIKDGTTTYYDPANKDENNQIVYVKGNKDMLLTWGIKEEKAGVQAIAVYPNPAAEAAVISYDITKPGKITTVITNVVGQQISSFQHDFSFIGNYQQQIDISNYQPGVYFVTTHANGQSVSKKLIIE